MTKPSALSIPPDLLPRDGRFGCGPALVRPAQVAAISKSGLLGTSHRQAPIKDLVGRIRSGLAELFDAPSDYSVVLGNGGASAFWALLAASVVRRRAACAVFGEFGAKCAAEFSRAPFLDDPLIFEAPGGHLAQVESRANVDVYAYPQQETSTGVLSPIERFSHPGEDQLVVVDATSIAGALQVDLNKIDIYYFAPQKAFGSDGGMWFAICSPRALERAVQIQVQTTNLDGSTDGGQGGQGPATRWIPEILDLSIAAQNSALNQTLNTPALATLIMLEEQIQWLLAQGGLPWAQSRVSVASRHIYEWAGAASFAAPFVSEPSWRSPVVCTIDLMGIEASDLLTILRANGIVDLNAYRKLGRNQIRIGAFPSTELEDVQALCASIDWVVGQLKD